MSVTKRSTGTPARTIRYQTFGVNFHDRMQCPNAWLDVFARSGTQNIGSLLQGLFGQRNRFSVGTGLTLTEGLDRPLQDFSVILFSLLTESNRPNLSHAARSTGSTSILGGGFRFGRGSAW